MIIIKFLFIIRACGSIEPFIFVAYYFTKFTAAVSSSDPTFESQTFLHNMDSIRVIIRKEIWRIRRGGQIPNRIFRGNRDGIWDQIWGISGYFMWVGYIINGDGRWMKIWATKISCKGII